MDKNQRLSVKSGVLHSRLCSNWSPLGRNIKQSPLKKLPQNSAVNQRSLQLVKEADAGGREYIVHLLTLLPSN